MSDRLPLPPLLQPPRQLKKSRLACNKWLARFLNTLAASAPPRGCLDHECPTALAARVLAPHRQASGFVALNGGILAGCTPHDLRRLLEAHGLLCVTPVAAGSSGEDTTPTPAPPPHRGVLQYSSTLPFVLCDAALRLPGAASGVSAVGITAGELARFTNASLASSSCVSEVGDCGGEKPTQTGTEDAAVEVVVLQVPETTALWKGGSSVASTTAAPSSSANKGCGTLYLVPCDVAAVRACVGHVFQRPVVGVEPLLRPSIPSTRGALAASSEPVRVCTARPVGEVPGLFLVPDFLSAAEEQAIWNELHAGRQGLQLEYLSRRRVAHFNRRFRYGVNALTDEGVEVNERPSFYGWMQARLQNDPGVRDDAAGHDRVCIAGDFPFGPGDYPCDQLTVNYYDYTEMGACGIAAHVDAHKAFDDAILIVSLGSYTVMEFSRWDAPADVVAPVGVFLAPRSLAVMTGEARYGWTHCIAEKRTDTLSELLPTFTRGDRMSLTWRRGRTQRHVKAECPYPSLCDGE